MSIVIAITLVSILLITLQKKSKPKKNTTISSRRDLASAQKNTKKLIKDKEIETKQSVNDKSIVQDKTIEELVVKFPVKTHLKDKSYVPKDTEGEKIISQLFKEFNDKVPVANKKEAEEDKNKSKNINSTT